MTRQFNFILFSRVGLLLLVVVQAQAIPLANSLVPSSNSTAFGFASLATDTAGDISAPLDPDFSPAGFTDNRQFAIFSATSLLGSALNNAMTFMIGLP